jgi:hypothetical protein
MSRTAWPRWCSIADASRLFAGEGVTVHRSNLSRYIDSRKIQKVDGKIDPNVLFDAYVKDHGRAMMAGQPSPPPSRPGSAPTLPLSAPQTPAPPTDTGLNDPKRELTELQARALRLKVAEQEGHTVAAETMAAGLAAALSAMRAKFTQRARAEASRLLTDLGLPGEAHPVALNALKRYALHAQEAWAEEAAKLMDPSTPEGMGAQHRLAALVALDLELRGLDQDGGEGEPAPETVPPEPATSS